MNVEARPSLRSTRFTPARQQAARPTPLAAAPGGSKFPPEFCFVKPEVCAIPFWFKKRRYSSGQDMIPLAIIAMSQLRQGAAVTSLIAHRHRAPPDDRTIFHKIKNPWVSL
jgi:hypothetical protein